MNNNPFTIQNTLIDPNISARTGLTINELLKVCNKKLTPKLSEGRLIIKLPKKLDIELVKILRGKIVYEELKNAGFFQEMNIRGTQLAILTGRVNENFFSSLLRLIIEKHGLSHRCRVFFSDRAVENQDFLIQDMRTQEWLVGVQCKDYLWYGKYQQLKRGKLKSLGYWDTGVWTEVRRRGEQCKKKKEWSRKKFLLMMSYLDPESPQKYQKFLSHVTACRGYDQVFQIWGFDERYDKMYGKIENYYVLNREKTTNLGSLIAFLKNTFP